MRIVLVRHSESVGNLLNTVDTGFWSSLTEQGKMEAMNLINVFLHNSIIISSPMTRSTETASIIFPKNIYKSEAAEKRFWRL